MDCPILYRSMIKHFKRVAFSQPFDPTQPICTSIVTITLCSPCGSHLPVVNACWEKVSPFQNDRLDLYKLARDFAAKKMGYSANSYMELLNDNLLGIWQPGLIFMQDNAPIHKAKKVIE